MSEQERTKPVLAWHFTRLDGTTDHLRTPQGVGKVYRVTPPVRCCEHGLHGSERAIDALRYAVGPLVRRTRHTGQFDRQDDKFCSSGRVVLWQADATRTLHEFACWVAEESLKAEQQQGREPDARSWRAIEAKRRWLRGEIDDSALGAARSAAESAARNAAWSAAESAARNAAWSAAESAAESAAWNAALSAAWRAALSAAESAAWSAAESAAVSAAWRAANTRLEAMLLALEPKDGGVP